MRLTPCQRHRAVRVLAGLVVSVFLLTACGESKDGSGVVGSESSTSTSAPPSTLPQQRSGSVKAQLISVATNLDEPVAIATVGSDTYVGEKAGRVRRIDEAHGNPIALDISRRVVSDAYEQGLLGMTFSPDQRYLYVSYTHNNGNIVVDALRWHGRGSPNSDWRTIISIPDPQSNHNGGSLEFGADSMLWMGIGDGGNANDEGEGHAGGGNGQSLKTLLGKMIRIDPTPNEIQPYGIPADNPFIGRSDALPEIWAYGLRNPWRFDLDAGMLWVADVGESSREEIDRVSSISGAGSNFGWNIYEGNSIHRSGRSADAVAPVFEYPHSNGNCAIIGGVVANDPSFRALNGKYLFVDSCVGAIKALSVDTQGSMSSVSLNANIVQPTTFGTDASGTLLVVSQAGTIYRIAPK